MKKLSLILGIAVVGLGIGCLEVPTGRLAASNGIIYQHHFVGTDALAQSTNATRLKEILALPSTAEVRNQALAKVAKAPQEFWKAQISPNAGDQSALIQPLLEDLLAAESYVEVRGPTTRPECALAIQLNDERARLWNTNLWKLALAWKLGVPTTARFEGGAGWELKKHAAPDLVQVVRAGKWLLVGMGQDKLTLLPALLQKTTSGGRPVAALAQDSLLELDADLPRLGAWFPVFAKNKLPPGHLSLLGRGEYVRTEARLRYSMPLPWKPEPWLIPTNLIRDPIVSFTVGQGIAPLLSQSKDVAQLGLKSLPNQFCAWGQSSVQGQTLIALPVNNASNVIKQLAPTLPKVVFANMTEPMGDFLWASNRAEIIWRGLPFIVPHLQAVRSGRTEFLFFSMFPMPPRSNAPPPELFAQLAGRNDLVYYNWEITQERLIHAKQAYQLHSIVNKRRGSLTQWPTQKWLMDIGPRLGNTVTEVSVPSPKELALVRKSHVGLTGFELASLARWIEAPGFPLHYEPPPTLASLRTNFQASLRTNPPANLRTNLPANPRTNLPAKKKQ